MQIHLFSIKIPQTVWCVCVGLVEPLNDAGQGALEARVVVHGHLVGLQVEKSR